MCENLEEEDDPELGLAGDRTIVRLVNLVLFQAFSDEATRIIFLLEGGAPGEAFDFLFESDVLDEKPASTRRFNFAIGYYSPYGFNELAPPPVYLFRPIINRLCVLSDIRHWARGPVEGCFTVEICGRGPISFTVHSDDLKEKLILRRATAGQLAAIANRKPIALPPLPEPLPDEPVPEFVLRPVPSPDLAHTIVWFIARTAFYGFVHLAVWPLATFDASLKSALPPWLCAGFAFLAGVLELPGSLLSFGDYRWPGPMLAALVWGMGIVFLVQYSTKRRA